MKSTLPVSALLLLGSALTAVSVGRAAGFQSLIERSPFSPAPSAAAAGEAPAEQGPLEFRGVVVDEAGTHYSVYDTAANRGRWLKAGENEGPLKVKSYDAANNTLEVDQSGKVVKLSLKRAVIQAGQSIAAMTPPPAPQNNSGPRPPGGNPTARPATPEADAKRIEAVAAEVRRRRALRTAAANGQPAPADAPAPAAAPAAPATPAPAAP